MLLHTDICPYVGMPSLTHRFMKMNENKKKKNEVLDKEN